MKSEILIKSSGPITEITLNRPDRGNTLTLSMLEQLEHIGRELVDDEHTRAVILRSSGDNFSYGMDIYELGEKGMATSGLKTRQNAELGGRMMRALQEIPQPTICAIQGVSTGGATAIATACDFRIASKNARMGYGEVKLGINLMWNGLPPAVRLVGPSRAKRLIMSGKLFDAQTLERWGFIDELCSANLLETTAREWAESYAALPPIAVRMIKRSINRVANAMDEAIMHADSDQWLLATQTADFNEAIAAFTEKRKPKFTGS